MKQISSWTHETTIYDINSIFLIHFQNGFLSSLPYMVQYFAVLLGGQMADWLLLKKVLSVTVVRKLATSIGKEERVMDVMSETPHRSLFVYSSSSGVVRAKEHDIQVRLADCLIVYRLIVEGVPLWTGPRNLPLQQLTWSAVMSISSVIRTLHLSAEWSDQAKTTLNYFSTKNSTSKPHEIVTGLPLTIRILFVRPLPGTRWN